MSQKKTVRRRTCEVIEIQIGYEQATFSIDIDKERGRYALAIEGSYGGFAYSWTSVGRSFHGFLADLNVGYVGGKMCQGERGVFDPERTTQFIREHICQYRRDGSYDAEFARQEWDYIERGIEHEGDFHDWMRDTEIECSYEFWVTKPGPRAEDFNRLYELFWPAFKEELLTVPE